MFVDILPNPPGASGHDRSAIVIKLQKTKNDPILRLLIGLDVVKKMGINPKDKVRVQFDNKTGIMRIKKDQIGFSAQKGQNESSAFTVRVSLNKFKYLYFPDFKEMADAIKPKLTEQDGFIAFSLNKRDYEKKD